MAKPKQTILDYLTPAVADRVQYADFQARPFSSFLRQAVHLSDAFNHCIRHFPSKRAKTDEFTKDSLHSLQEIASPLLAAMMANLELLQRCIYACLFDLTYHIPGYSPRDLARNLRNAEINVDILHVIGYRGAQTAAGNIVADALTGWHDPSKVNAYFQALLNVAPFYSDAAKAELAVMWQMRHSIVHTGGTLTVPDSQKLDQLATKGGTAIVFRPQIFPAVVIRLHVLLKETHDGFFPKVQARFKSGYVGSVKQRLDQLFELKSPREAWLK